jgi:DNA-binding NtrC family response regulator
MANVVIVDDMINTRVVLEEYLKGAGHRVIGNFEDAIEAYYCIFEDRPEIVLLDYNLNSYKDGKPYTGLDLLEDIRAFDSKIKVIFISAFADQILIKKAIVKGAIDVIVKPFKATDLIERVNRAAV